MIKNLHVENFQSHENSHVEFAPGVNVVVGTSDGGKSALLRALNWVATNRPTGEAFRSRWGGDTVVTAVLADGGAVERLRSDKKNEYRLFADDPQAESTVLKAVGQDVPAEVAAALRLGDVNIQYQMDSPFLLSRDWSPGRVAEYLNEIVGLDAIDRAQATVDGKLRGLRAQTTQAEADQVAGRQAVEALAYVDELDAACVRLEGQAGRAARVRQQEQQLFAAVNAAKAAEGLVAGLPNYGRAGIIVDDLLEKDVRAGRLEIEAAKLVVDLEAVEKVGVEVVVADRVLAAEGSLVVLQAGCRRLVELNDESSQIATAAGEARDLAGKIEPVDAMLKAGRLLDRVSRQEFNRKTAATEAGNLETLIAGITACELSAERAADVLCRLEDEWKRTAPDVCPLCEGKGKLK